MLCFILFFLSWPVFADEVSDQNSEETQETESTIPTPTVAPFDFAFLEQCAADSLQRLDRIILILTGIIFFLGIGSGLFFAKVLFDRIRTV